MALSIRRLDSKLRQELDKRGVKWAQDVCTASRSVHVDVWRDCPEREYVYENVIPLLELARNELFAMVNCTNLPNETRDIFFTEIRNIEWRISNIREKYLGEESSGFP